MALGRARYAPNPPLLAAPGLCCDNPGVGMSGPSKRTEIVAMHILEHADATGQRIIPAQLALPPTSAIPVYLRHRSWYG